MCCDPKENGKGRLAEALGSQIGTLVPSLHQGPMSLSHVRGSDTQPRQPMFVIFLLQDYPGSILYTYLFAEERF